MKLFSVFVKAPHIDKPFTVFAEDYEDAANIVRDETNENVDYPIEDLTFPKGQRYVLAYVREASPLGDFFPKRRITADMLTEN